MQANADAMRAHDNAESEGQVHGPIDLRLLCNAERKPSYMLAFETGFRDVINLLRPAVPMELALRMCTGLGQGTVARFLSYCLKTGSRSCLFLASSMEGTVSGDALHIVVSKGYHPASKHLASTIVHCSGLPDPEIGGLSQHQILRC